MAARRRLWSAPVAVLLALLLCCGPRPGHSAPAEAPRAESGVTAAVLTDRSLDPPDAEDPRWQVVTLPRTVATDVLWIRLQFEITPEAARHAQALYLPYLYGGGRFWLDGRPLSALAEESSELHVRWERPHLLPLPQGALPPGRHTLLIRTTSAERPAQVNVPRIEIGPALTLQPRHDLRSLWVRSVPQLTVATGVIVGLLVLSIWLRRPSEVEYGLFGLAALLWALRTTTFTLDVMPQSLWPAWRLLYYTATGGFLAALALFTAHMARRWNPRVAWVLAGYVAAGPLLFLLAGDRGDEWVGRWWVLGLVPIAAGMVGFALLAAWRRPRLGTRLIALCTVLTLLAGVHDYFVAWTAPWLERLLPHWTGQRYFLLHHAANLLLVVMGLLLSTRLVRSLSQVEESNRTLEARVAAREREIAANYEQITELRRLQAVQDERQRMVQDLHDGLGSQLFSSLMRAERGALDSAGTVDTLREAIDEMRVAIEAMTPEDSDFRTAFGNFRWRWDQRLRDAGLQVHWQVDWPDAVLALPPSHALQVLRVTQESLTNVLKHARARQVWVQLRVTDGGLALDVRDDGDGAGTAPAAAGGAASTGSRGLANMRARAAQIGAKLQARFGAGGGQVSLHLPWPPA